MKIVVSILGYGVNGLTHGCVISQTAWAQLRTYGDTGFYMSKWIVCIPINKKETFKYYKIWKCHLIGDISKLVADAWLIPSIIVLMLGTKQLPTYLNI